MILKAQSEVSDFTSMITLDSFPPLDKGKYLWCKQGCTPGQKWCFWKGTNLFQQDGANFFGPPWRTRAEIMIDETTVWLWLLSHGYCLLSSCAYVINACVRSYVEVGVYACVYKQARGGQRLIMSDVFLNDYHLSFWRLHQNLTDLPRLAGQQAP